MSSSLVDSAVQVERQRQVAAKFLASPAYCDSFFAARMRLNFPDARSLLSHGILVLEAWASGGFLAIDYAECSHADMRLDLRSSGAARKYTTSSNRTFCRQFMAHHGRLVKANTPSVSSPGAALVAGEYTNQAALVACGSLCGRRSVGGNGRLAWQNHCMASWKALRAPSRKMTAEDVLACCLIVRRGGH